MQQDWAVFGAALGYKSEHNLQSIHQLPMVSLRLVALSSTLALAIAQPVQSAKRSFLDDIFHDVADATSAVIHGLLGVVGVTENALLDVVCAAENFSGAKKAPHTNGIEWYEDPEYLAALILSSGPAQWIQNKSLETVEQIIEGAEAQGSDFLVKLAGFIGLSPEAAALSNKGFPIINHFAAAIVKAIADGAILVATSPAVAHTVDNFINLVIKSLEEAGISLAEEGGTLLLAQFGVGVFIAPAVTTVCTVGGVAANAVTSLEACFVKLSILSQVLSEGQILLQQCAAT